MHGKEQVVNTRNVYLHEVDLGTFKDVRNLFRIVDRGKFSPLGKLLKQRQLSFIVSGKERALSL